MEITQPNISDKYQVYSPTSVIGIFNNALKLPATVNLIYLKGRYSYGGGKAYVNYYYDFLFSESDNVSIGVKMPGLLRSQIVNNEIYTLRGYIEKRLRNSSIDLVFVVDEIIAQEEKTISEDDLKRYDLIQKKLEKDSVDLQTLIREKILSGQKIRIANIYGHNAIVQRDFSEGLDVSSTEFEITDFTCNITSTTSIISQLNNVSSGDFDIIALVRGGGDRQSFEVFNDLALAEKFIDLPALTVTALGHTVDETLLDKLSDRRFHLPHDYGASLHVIVNKLVEEKSNSRALLIEEVKKDVTKQFEEQVKTLSEQLGNKNKEFEKLQEDSAKQISKQTETVHKQMKMQAEEMEKYKSEIASLHEKNIKEAVRSETASLSAKLDIISLENSSLKEDIRSRKKTNIWLYLILIILGLVVGILLSKL
ncbi:exodeoxyribonuclease VII large subunit [Chryseobacterium taklimakanense]|uniref:Exodeoxyribonuclease VII large subunit n=1 Tax=Chryseobacterium taklimakanense TaxID=536441 RepID=A0A239WED1_9FLAO|nr:exodeoxyribonuclease VII large subunit [Chryseobacterium taklimakanense]SNV31974.1 exodeoxyribonuclease VII large subunit [Chryseobacterium taklimakanense]